MHISIGTHLHIHEKKDSHAKWVIAPIAWHTPQGILLLLPILIIKLVNAPIAWHTPQGKLLLFPLLVCNKILF